MPIAILSPMGYNFYEEYKDTPLGPYLAHMAEVCYGVVVTSIEEGHNPHTTNYHYALNIFNTSNVIGRGRVHILGDANTNPSMAEFEKELARAGALRPHITWRNYARCDLSITREDVIRIRGGR